MSIRTKPLIAASTNRRGSSPWTAAIAATTLALAGCQTTYRPPEATTKTTLKQLTFPDRGPGRIEVRVQYGHVLIQHGPVLSGDAEIRVRGDSEADALQRQSAIDLESSLVADTFVLRANHPAGAPLDAVNVRYRLQVPDDIEVSVLGGAADVAIRGFRGHVNARTDGGEILARPAGGTLVLATESGGIRLDGEFASAELETTRGDIEITLPRATFVDLKATSDTGRLLIDLSESCCMLLEYRTDTGSLRTDLPVEWDTNGAFEDNRRVYRGRIGEKHLKATVKATITSRESELEIRRMSGPAQPTR